MKTGAQDGRGTLQMLPNERLLLQHHHVSGVVNQTVLCAFPLPPSCYVCVCVCVDSSFHPVTKPIAPQFFPSPGHDDREASPPLERRRRGRKTPYSGCSPLKPHTDGCYSSSICNRYLAIVSRLPYVPLPLRPQRNMALPFPVS